MSQNGFISAEDIDKALHFLRDSAAPLGHARAESVRASHMVKHVKALEMAKRNEMPVSKAEMLALTTDAYLDAINADAIATGEFEKLKALREAAAMRIEAWRTQESSLRHASRL